ncbi:MAG: hypothetical protein V8T10_06150 [Merdibacter sp.]
MLLVVQKLPELFQPLRIIAFFNVGSCDRISSLLIQKGAEIFRLCDEGLIFSGDGIPGESDTGDFKLAFFIELAQIRLGIVLILISGRESGCRWMTAVSRFSRRSP